MLRIVTGPYHPDLENALVEEIRRCKATDPFLPVAIVVPSNLLSARLRERLVLVEGLALLNVHFLTFHQLAVRLYEERQRYPASPTDSAPVELAPDFFFQYLLRQIGLRNMPGLAALDLAHLPPGGLTALWSTIRDLKDSAIDPDVAQRAVAEGVFEAELEDRKEQIIELTVEP